MIRSFLAALATVLALTDAASAADTLARYRGTVETRVDETLTLRRDSGERVTVTMNPKSRLLIATPGTVRDIKPESYISVISAEENGARAVRRVALYSPSERGFEAGDRAWDTAPDARLTAGWITDRTGRDPVEVRLRYPEGTADFAIPPGTPVTQIGPGEKALLVPGAQVVVFARTDAGGTRNADLVAVGRLGVRPAL